MSVYRKGISQLPVHWKRILNRIGGMILYFGVELRLVEIENCFMTVSVLNWLEMK